MVTPMLRMQKEGGLEKEHPDRKWERQPRALQTRGDNMPKSSSHQWATRKCMRKSHWERGPGGPQEPPQEVIEAKTEDRKLKEWR